jgi:hypothetical protein
MQTQDASPCRIKSEVGETVQQEVETMCPASEFWMGLIESARKEKQEIRELREKKMELDRLR